VGTVSHSAGSESSGATSARSTKHSMYKKRRIETAASIINGVPTFILDLDEPNRLWSRRSIGYDVYAYPFK
jgi:hypothetical protein